MSTMVHFKQCATGVVVTPPPIRRTVRAPLSIQTEIAERPGVTPIGLAITKSARSVRQQALYAHHTRACSNGPEIASTCHQDKSACGSEMALAA